MDNECVIVPDFGGFVTHYASARYEDSDHSFLPPLRTLGFNPQLRINDSLLVQSYVTAYDISYPEALRRIEAEVEELKQTLRTEGRYVMDDIGTLSVNSDGNYQFEPCEAGVLSPDLYGLGNFEFLRLKDFRESRTLQVANVNTATAQQDAATSEDDNTPALLDFTDTPDDGERAIRIKMSWIRNAVAAAAAIIAFFLMATPVANSDLGTRTMSNLQNGLLQKLMPKDTNMAPATAVVPPTVLSDSAALAANAADTTATAQPEPTVTDAPQVQEGPRYCIVLASQVRKTNAEYYVEQLHKRGLKDAEVYIHKNTVRVIYGSFATEGEAHTELNKLNNSEEFAEAWVYRIVES